MLNEIILNPTLFVETVIIKNQQMAQNNHRNCQKVKIVDNLTLT